MGGCKGKMVDGFRLTVDGFRLTVFGRRDI